MNIKKLIWFWNGLSVWSVILVPLIWIILKNFELLTLEFLGFTLYTWLYIISWYAVVFVMAIRPLADIFPKHKIFRQLCVLRKAFWILSAMIIVTLLFDKWIWNTNSFIAFFSFSAWSWWYPLIARLSELTALILLFTSNNFSVKKLWRNWKRIQRTSYIYLITWWILAMRYGDDYGVMISMIAVLLLYPILFMKKSCKCVMS